MTVCQEYFKRKKRAPRFREHIIERATRALAEIDNQSDADSIAFSSSMFEFPTLMKDDSEDQGQNPNERR